MPRAVPGIQKIISKIIMTKAIFWDRDGVLNHVIASRGDGQKNVSPQKFEDFKLVPGAAEMLQETKALGYLNIIITNQPDIARSKMSWDELKKMHDFLKKKARTINAIFVCAHDSNENCECRKPKPGLLLEAAKDYHLNLAKCFMVGDSQSDIDAGHNAGTKTILKKTSYNFEVKGYDFLVTSLEEIISIIS